MRPGFLSKGALVPRSLIRLLVPALLAGLIGFVPASAGVAARTPCDPLDPALCMLPFPNDYFTRPALALDHSWTGKVVDVLPAEMPHSLVGKPIEPTEWNRQDGFSPGSMVLTFVPGLDLHRTWGTTSAFAGDPRLGGPNDPRDHIADIGRYTADNAPILLIDSDTGERWPFWSELDLNSQTKPEERLLILRPAKNFLEGHRYLVALRNLRDASGADIPASEVFKQYRDGILALSPRGEHINGVVAEIAAAEAERGFNADDLYLAWDFTIASRQNLSERVLHIRDTALGLLGDTTPASGINGAAPAFTASVTQAYDDGKPRRIEGTVTVPNFLDRPPVLPSPVPEKDPVAGLPVQALGGRFLYGPDGLPMQNPVFPTVDVPYVCTVPQVATPSNPAHPTLYGHGLLGSRNESSGGSTDRDRERNFMPCGVNWMGFAEYDIVNAVHTLLDPSNMATMADRSQQGFLNWIVFSRAIVHSNGFAANAAFQVGGQPLFQTGKLVYDGNSQGGIMGGALCALSVDLTRCVLGVTGMNYSTLLNRSVDWEGPLLHVPEDPTNPSQDPEDYLPSYSSLLYTMFPNKQEQQLVMALLQMLWDRAEADGYAQHMTTEPLPKTPEHQVLMHVAYGDFQVTNFSAEVEARTIGARVMDTALDAVTNTGSPRNYAVNPFYGLTPFPRSGSDIAPWNGSALVYWDSGNLLPPNANVPPALTEGIDPHEDPRRDHRAGDQKATFWLTGMIEDVMNGGPYLLCRPGHEANIPRAPSQFSYDWCV
jgi:hypothetical protein